MPFIGSDGGNYSYSPPSPPPPPPAPVVNQWSFESPTQSDVNVVVRADGSYEVESYSGTITGTGGSEAAQIAAQAVLQQQYSS